MGAKSISNYSVSFVIPAFNEAASLESVVIEIIEVMSNLKYEFEIIIINDGSTDDTHEKIANLSRKFQDTISLKSIHNLVNKGYGYSLKKGAKNANYDYLCFFDADGQHLPQEIPKLLESLDSEIDVIIGSRVEQNSSPIWRKPGKFVVKKIAEYICQEKIPDLFSGLRIWKKDSFREIERLLPSGFSLSTTSMLAAKFNDYSVKWVPVRMVKRQGKSSATVKDGFQILLLLLRISTLFSPLKIFIPISFFIASLGLIFIAASYRESGVSSLRGLITLLIALLVALQGLVVDQVSALRRGEIVKNSK